MLASAAGRPLKHADHEIAKLSSSTHFAKLLLESIVAVQNDTGLLRIYLRQRTGSSLGTEVPGEVHGAFVESPPNDDTVEVGKFFRSFDQLDDILVAGHTAGSDHAAAHRFEQGAFGRQNWGPCIMPSRLMSV